MGIVGNYDCAVAPPVRFANKRRRTASPRILNFRHAEGTPAQTTKAAPITEFGGSSANVGNFGPEVAQVGSISAGFGPRSANLRPTGPKSAKLDQICPEIGQSRNGINRARPEFSNTRRKLARNRTKLGWPRSTLIRFRTNIEDDQGRGALPAPSLEQRPAEFHQIWFSFGSGGRARRDL